MTKEEIDKAIKASKAIDYHFKGRLLTILDEASERELYLFGVILTLSERHKIQQFKIDSFTNRKSNP